jgi:4'-phosphopantetheinyl transferase
MRDWPARTAAKFEIPSPSRPLVELPAENEVHVYWQPLAQKAMPGAQEWALLAAAERMRASSFRRPLDRQRFVACRAWLRRVLASYLADPAGGIEFRYSPAGKPQLAGESARLGLSFNVSHSGGWALLGIARGARLGVDLEQHRPLADRDALVRRFSPSEQRAYFGLSPQTQEAAFFAAWTRKEAVFKACGEGAAISLAEFDVSLDPHEAVLLAIGYDREAARGWTLTAPAILPGFSAAVAIEVSRARLVLQGEAMPSDTLPAVSCN